jgi:hypothetical protein
LSKRLYAPIAADAEENIIKNKTHCTSIIEAASRCSFDSYRFAAFRALKATGMLSRTRAEASGEQRFATLEAMGACERTARIQARFADLLVSSESSSNTDSTARSRTPTC